MRSVRSLPPGYTRVDVDRIRGFSTDAAAPWLRDVLHAHPSLHSWAETHPTGETRPGRGTVHVVPAPLPGPDGRARWAVRHYRRGGAIARALGDRYLAGGSARPRIELKASVVARKAGVPTPAVVAGVTHRRDLFYRADLVTEFVEDAWELAAVLFPDVDGPPTSRPAPGDIPSPEACLDAARALIDKLVAAGIRHADLNARNVLLETYDGGVRGWILDLDRARIVEPGRPSARAMRLRLARSLRKIAAASGAAVPKEWASLLVEGA